MARLFIFLVAFLSLISLIKASKLSKNELKNINTVLDKWDARIHDTMAIREGLEFYNKTISQVEKKLPELKGHPDILRKLYSVAFRTFDHLSAFYDLADSKDKVLDLLSSLYGFFSVLFNNDYFTDDEMFDYFIKAVNRLIRNGQIGYTYYNLIKYDFKKDADVIQIVYYLALFFNASERLVGIEPLIQFFFHFLKIAASRGHFLAIFESQPNMAVDCLKFIHRYAPIIGAYYSDWNSLYFKYIHTIFENHLNETDVKILLDLTKEVKEENDVDWVVGIFSASNLANFIYSTPKLLASALDTMAKLQVSFTLRFQSCLQTLGPKAGDKLSSHIQERETKKAQIYTVLEARKLLPRFKNSSAGSYKDLADALTGMNALKLELLKPEDASSIGNVALESFLSLYDEFQISYSEIILTLLNEFIPILLKLQQVDADNHDKLREVVVLFSDRLAIKFAQRTEEIQLNEIGPLINQYRGEIFLDSGEKAYHLSKFFMFWKLNAFGMRVVIDFITQIGWYSEEIFINNLLLRVSKFSIMKGINDPAEAADLEQIIDYFYTDMRILSKTQRLALLQLIK